MTGPAMILMRTPTWAKVLLAMLVGALFMWLTSCYRDAEARKGAVLRAQSDSIAALRPALDSALKLANAHVDTVTKDRVIYTDRILAGDRPAIPRAEVVELANKCTEVEKSCAERQAAAAALIANLNSQLDVEKKRVTLMPPRLRLGVEGGWSFVSRYVPLRGRGELRIAGPISLIGEVEVRMSADSFAVKPDYRALVHYQFR